jgi:hypothetical protein
MLALFGDVTNPLPQVGPGYGSVKEGLPALIGNLVGLITTLGGIGLLINGLIAGLDFITASGDPKKIERAWGKIYISIVGLVIIVAAFLITGITGKLLFGDYSAFLTPKLFGPGKL